MPTAQIQFSRPKLLGYALVGLAFGGPTMLMAFAVGDDALMRHGRILRLLGPFGMRLFLVAAGLFFLAAACGLIRRLLDDRPLAAIRYDGIELNGVFMSRYIPWRYLDVLRLRVFGARGKTSLFLHAGSRCPPDSNPLHHYLANLSHGVSLRLSGASDENAAQWVRDALAARAEASTPRQSPEPANRPRREPTRVTFGRRAG